MNNNRKSSYTKVTRDNKFPLGHFIAMCENNDGLGIYHFCVRMGDTWQSSCPIFISPQEQLEEIKQRCERWLKQYDLPLNSVTIKTVWCED